VADKPAGNSRGLVLRATEALQGEA
jgi:hypothetical protein